jgi:hypothetical protein
MFKGAISEIDPARVAEKLAPNKGAGGLTKSNHWLAAAAD